MKRSRTVIGTAACVALASLATGCGQAEFSAASFANKVPPELSAAGTWLNTDEPLQLADLHGELVWLEFGFLH